MLDGLMYKKIQYINNNGKYGGHVVANIIIIIHIIMEKGTVNIKLLGCCISFRTM